MGTTCTVIMPIEAEQGMPTIDTGHLIKANYQFQTPCVLPLQQGEIILDQLVRLVPHKRMVAFGTWRGLSVVAKLFFDKKQSERHFNAELKGVNAMLEYKIPAPHVHYSGKTEDQKGHVIIFERLQHAHNLETLWLNRESDEHIVPVLHAVMIEVATQHVLGVKQRDMHLGNFMLSGKTIYTLDGADIQIEKNMLDRQDSIENVALLLSQLGAGVETLKQSLFLHYAKARGWLLKSADMIEVTLQLKRCDSERWRRFSKKILRASTEHEKIKRFGYCGMLRRECHAPEMLAFLQEPDKIFSDTNAVMLKDGRSSTVIRVMLDGRDIVIKRYNMKHIWHRLRRLFRRTRAEHSWVLAQKLRLFQVNTPLPIAYLESNTFGMRGKSYFISEFVAGTDVKAYLAPFEHEPYMAAKVIQRIGNLISSLLHLEITHGDLKATNIIIAADEKPYLIDLDGAAEHYTHAGLKQTMREEVQRFLQNFADMPMLKEVLRRTIKM